MGGQLGSTLLLLACDCIAAPQEYLARIFLLCQLAPHGREDSAAIEISAFRRISGEADMSYFFRKRTCTFRSFERSTLTRKIPDHKKLFEFVVDSRDSKSPDH